MTIQTIQFESVSLRQIGSGTITAEIYSGSTSAATLSSITEDATRDGRYTGTVEDQTAGTYDLQVQFDGVTVSEPDERVTLLLAVGTYVAKRLVELDSSSVSAVADQVWDEDYADHNSAGSFGKLLNTIRKSNLAIEGVVTNAVSPTAISFASNVSATTGAYGHAVLLFTSGSLAGENSPIITYTNSNGAIVLEEALTSAPAVNDEFVIIAGSHVHSVASIKSGLSTLTAANVNAEVVDALSVDTYAELSAPPAATSSLKDKITWLFMYARNKVTQTALARTLYRDDTTTVAGTSATSDNGTTFTKGEDT